MQLHTLRTSLWSGILIFVSSTGFSQVDTATITGTVLDPSGAAVIAARIRATNQATGLDYRSSSGEGGVYVLSALPVGAFDLEVSGPGFQSIRRRDITLNAGIRALLEEGLVASPVRIPQRQCSASQIRHDQVSRISRDLALPYSRRRTPLETRHPSASRSDVTGAESVPLSSSASVGPK